MRVVKALTVLAALSIAPAWASANWTILNKDAGAHDYTQVCGAAKSESSVLGNGKKSLPLPPGADHCTISMKRGGSCTVHDGEGCTIESGRLSRSAQP